MKAVEKDTKPSFLKLLKLRVERFMTGLIDKIGFFGILLCASVSKEPDYGQNLRFLSLFAIKIAAFNFFDDLWLVRRCDCLEKMFLLPCHKTLK